MTGPTLGVEISLCSELARQSQERPDHWFVRFSHSDLSFAQAERRSRRLAVGLRALGIGPDSVVPGMLPNCEESVLAWLACNRLGATWAPLNTEFRGLSLAHAINLVGSTTLLVHDRFIEAVRDIRPDLEHLEQIVVVGGSRVDSDSDSDAAFLQYGDLLIEGEWVEENPSSADSSLLIFTSGTTGRSKACELTHHYLIGQARMMIECAELSADDVLYCPYPLFHIDATALTTVPALLLGATAVIPQRFSVSRFWTDIRQYGCTTFDFMGATLGFLFNQEACPNDRDHSARLGWGVPMPPFRREFEERFGVRLMEGYGATECGCPVWQFPGECYPKGSCGRCHPEYEIEIVDSKGRAKPTGQIGELLVRPKHPDMVMKGYYRDAEANKQIFRFPGAVSMGDLGRVDAKGNLFFEGRREDAIRRRGENISATEIEETISQHPAVLEVAALGIPDGWGEDEVAVAVALRPDFALTENDLIEWCEGKMARHMLPEHVKVLKALPKTSTRKISRNKIREIYFRN